MLKPTVMGVLLLSAFAAFIALGIWQLERRIWKLELIRTVHERIDAAPVDAPGPPYWDRSLLADEAYRRVRVTGRFSNDAPPALVQAVTRLGPGFWVVVPLVTDRGFTVLINRGFVTGEESRSLPASPEGDVEVTGLLRLTEPDGAFLRSNDPAQDRWYSRDVAAIAAARGLEGVAPYFIDADASSSSGAGPVGGLTVVAFRNHHLVYAMTWFSLAAMMAGWTAYLIRDGRRPDSARRRSRTGSASGTQ